jgi:transposase
MENATIIGIDLAKRAFQLHGASADGSAAFRRKLTREKLLTFLAGLPKGLVAMEACATSHFWGREIAKLGHEVKLVPPIYVKPYVKRQKNDAADAEAIAEAASRPTMRFVGVKTEEQQAQGMTYRVRELFVRQRTQIINALRGHLAEYGVIAPQGVVYVARLVEAIEDPEAALPSAVRELGRMLVKQIAELQEKIDALEKEIKVRSAQDENAARLMSMPGIGPICAMAIQAFAPPMESFGNGRDFAAWTGLTPRQNSTGGKQTLGKTSKMGQRDIRRLLISGATVVVRWAARKGAPEGSWLARMLARKPRMLVATSLANRMARAVWAMTTKKESYRVPATT